jgi:hypothetical protein
MNIKEKIKSYWLEALLVLIIAISYILLKKELLQIYA